DPLGPAKKKIKLPESVPDGKFGLHMEDAGGISPSPVPIRVVDLPYVLEIEPNNAPPQATVGQVPCAFNGVIDQPGDHDHFKFNAKKGQVFDIRCHARRLGSPLDP